MKKHEKGGQKWSQKSIKTRLKINSKIDAKKGGTLARSGTLPDGPGDNLINKISLGNFLNRNLSKEKNILRRLFPWKNPRKGKFLEENSRKKIRQENPIGKSNWKILEGKSNRKIQ